MEDILKPGMSLLEHFSDLTDPRLDRTKAHKLIDIVGIAICTVICGADFLVTNYPFLLHENSKMRLINRLRPRFIPSI